MSKKIINLVNKTFLFCICLVISVVATLKITIHKFSKKIVIPNIFIFSITKEQAIRNGSFKDFDSFFRDPRLGFNKLHSSKVIEIKHVFPIGVRNKPKDWIITRDVSTYLLLNFFTIYEMYSIIFVIFQSTNFSEKLINKSELKLIKKSSFDMKIWELFLQKSNYDFNLITTQSQLRELPVHFYVDNNRIIRHMLWYSVNSIPIQKWNEKKYELYLGNLICKNIDCHYVWNKDQEKDLMSYGVKKCKVVGSILFYPPRNEYKERKKVITFFDITPYKDANTIYTEDFSIEILKRLLLIIEEISSENATAIKVRVKPKRLKSKYHSKKYTKYLEYLERQGMIAILDPGTNLYDCISESMGVLATPFSSPVAIGKELGVPSAYFLNDDGNSDLTICKEPEDLLRNPTDLRNWLQAVLVQFEKRT